MKLVCAQCNRTIRSDSNKAIKLWETPTGPKMVCGQKCYDKFNAGEDV